MPNSTFYYEIDKYEDIQLVWIVDKNIGCMSVTRDMKNVVRYICNINNIKEGDRGDYLWIYADTDGIWDAYDPITEEFIELAVSDIVDAIDKYLNIRKQEMVQLIYNF